MLVPLFWPAVLMTATVLPVKRLENIPRKLATVASELIIVAVTSNMQRNPFSNCKRRSPPLLLGWRFPYYLRCLVIGATRQARLNDSWMSCRNLMEDYITHGRLP
jgi:hypothetical protein